MGIDKIAVDLGRGGFIQRAADRMPLHDAAAGYEGRVIVSHPILVRRGPHERREPKRHIVTEMDRAITCKHLLQRVGSTEMKRVKQGIA